MCDFAFGSPVFHSDELIGLVAVTGGLALGMISIVLCTIRGIVRTRAREQTKREIAAYVAEGSIRPEDAERIIKADLRPWECLGDRRA
jgi:hypothetical protein